MWVRTAEENKPDAFEMWRTYSSDRKRVSNELNALNGINEKKRQTLKSQFDR